MNSSFRSRIQEIFSNAVLHSRTESGISSCDQFFPKRHRLDFSVADLGIGMRRNIQENMGLELSPEAAIAWAIQERNTTKRDSVSGGLGLKLLSEFIGLNGGAVASGSCRMSDIGGVSGRKPLPCPWLTPFPALP